MIRQSLFLLFKIRTFLTWYIGIAIGVWEGSEFKYLRQEVPKAGKRKRGICVKVENILWFLAEMERSQTEELPWFPSRGLSKKKCPEQIFSGFLSLVRVLSTA